jgi:hypothetical protein
MESSCDVQELRHVAAAACDQQPVEKCQVSDCKQRELVSCWNERHLLCCDGPGFWTRVASWEETKNLIEGASSVKAANARVQQGQHLTENREQRQAKLRLEPPRRKSNSRWM